MPKLLFLSGSIRQGSFNTTLAHAAHKEAQAQSADAEFIDLADYSLPLFNEDLETEKGMPEAAKKLKEKFIQADGFFIASPEYNSSLTPLLKNTIDWMSRSHTEQEAPLIAFAGKAAAICGASPGGFGGMRALVPLRLLLANINVNVVGRQLAVSSAHEAFDSQGELQSEYHQKALKTIISELIKIS